MSKPLPGIRVDVRGPDVRVQLRNDRADLPIHEVIKHFVIPMLKVYGFEDGQIYHHLAKAHTYREDT